MVPKLIWIYAEFSDHAHFSVFDHKYPSWTNLVQKFKNCLFKVKFHTNSNMQSSMLVSILSVLNRKLLPFCGKFGPKNHNCQFKLKNRTYINSDMKNSIVIFIFFCFRLEVSFCWKFVPKIKIVC